MAYTVQKIGLLLLATIMLSLTNFWMPTALTQASQSWWSRIFSSRPPDLPRPRGSRGDYFCLITPVATSEMPRVWRDRPTLVWQGSIESVELWQSDGARRLWRTRITEENQLQQVQLEAGRSAYRVTAPVELQPNQQYEWRIRPFSTESLISIPFRSIPAQEQVQIQQNLPEAETGEATVIARADYFASQQLWMDFWREVLSIEQPSTDLKRTISNTFSQFCPQIDVQDSFSLSSRRLPTGQPYRDFPLTGTVGEAIEISLESDDFEPALIVLNPEGEIIKEVANEGDQFRLEISLPDAGEYTIRTISATQSTGSFRLRVVSLW